MNDSLAARRVGRGTAAMPETRRPLVSIARSWAMPGVAGLLALGPGISLPQAAAPEDYALWSHAADLYLDTSPDGANVTGTVTGFPLLVRLRGPDFPFAQARGAGQDIRFSKPPSPGAADGAHLAYQIESWDSAGASADIWVRVDTVRGNASTQKLRMHWGGATAADSSSGPAVFAAAGGYQAVWHLGGPAGPRANSADPAVPALPQNYDGNEARPGAVGGADSLDGQDDHLDIGPGYGNLGGGFTFSAWVYPAGNKASAHLLHIGNGAGLENIIVGRPAGSEDLHFENYSSVNGRDSTTAKGALAQDQWQHIAVTVSGNVAGIYRNGVLVRADTLTSTISGYVRAFNYLGHSLFAGDAPFQGKLDEVRIARAARSADWIKLSHANQKSGQTLVRFQAPNPCQMRFAVSADTVLSEGSHLQLAGTADCATRYSWSLVSGAGPRILDPDVKQLEVYLPRITADLDLVYRFTATFPDSVRLREVKVKVQETIPDPLFALPADTAWNGRDSLLIRPVISNLAAVKASRDSVIHFLWTLADLAADTAWRDGALLLKASGEEGALKVGLCLDNGGTRNCAVMAVAVRNPVGVAAGPKPARALPQGRGRDLAGRLLTGGPKRRSAQPIFSGRARR